MRDEPVPCAGGGASPGPREVKTPEIFCLSVAAPSPSVWVLVGNVETTVSVCHSEARCW
jgi:hypothetical protein